MRRARKPALLRAALATALAAITIPFITHAAFGDETAVSETADLAGAAASVPPAPEAPAVLPTYQGVTIAWPAWTPTDGTSVRGYVIHRYRNGQETTQSIEPNPYGRQMEWYDEISPTPGTEYAVSIVNEIGEGPAGPRSAMSRPTDQIALTDGLPSELMAAGLAGYVVPLDLRNSVTPKEAVASSPDGRSVAFVTTNYERILWTQRVTPTELGTPVQLWTSSTRSAITHLSWSPDGARIAFQTPENGTPCVYVVPATGGTAEKITCDVTSPSWMPDGRTLVVVDRRFDGDDRFARIEAAPGGARVATLPAATAAADGMPVRVSPDGRLVAFGSDRYVKVVDFTSDQVQSSLAFDAAIRSISWNPDGSRALMVLGTNSLLYRLDTDNLGVAPTQLANDHHPGARLDIAWQRLGPAIAPTPTVVGQQTTVAFDGSALLDGTTFSCAVNTSTASACTSPYTATNLRTGENTLTITATEPDGRVTKAYRILTADASGPVARVTGPNYQSAVAATAKVTVAATDASGVASYDVRYRRASFAGPYSAYIQPWTNTTATSMNLAVAAGYEYCVSVRAKDKFGNVGGWSAERCFSRPLDDRSMTMATTGWARGASTKFYFGTDTQTTAYGKALTRTVQGKRFFLVATRCPSCGAVAVYAGNKLLTTVNLAYPTTHYQVMLGLPVQNTLFSGTLTVRTVTSGKLVQIDGLAVGRS